jgi:hypothetical protein
MATFGCGSAGYLIQGQTLIRVDIALGNYTTVKSTVGNASINAMGYNVADNFLYAAMGSTPSSLVRISSTGDSAVLGSLNVTTALNTGDVDQNSQYWASASGNQWIQVDLKPGSATFGKTVASGTSTAPYNVIDWAYVPGGGNFLYALGNDLLMTNTFLMSWDLSAKTWQVLVNFNNVAGKGLLLNRNSWGAVYASSDGYLYGSENNSGEIWKFPLPSVGTTPTKVSTGPASSNNDGARCINAAVPS